MLTEQRAGVEFGDEEVCFCDAFAVFQRVVDDAVPDTARVEARLVGVVEQVLRFLRRELHGERESQYFLP